MAQNGGSERSPKDSLIEEVSRLINERTGIQLGPKQVAMVESRLKRRIYELGLSQFSDYRKQFNEHRDSELEALVSLLTTHHTFFFREFVQFEFLEQQLPTLVENARARGAKMLEIYSAACSRGQEVYSLAMHLKKHLKIIAPDFDFRIFGSDVDPASVEIAKNGVYRREEIKSVPMVYLGDHWARGTGEIADFVKAKKSIRSHCDFASVNLIDLKGIEGRKFDVIFCRNVFIYFTPLQIKAITTGLLKNLHPGGLFFVGVSESLYSMGLPLKAVGASVYADASILPVVNPSSPEGAVAKPIRPLAVSALPNPLRIVCVDDSPSILSLLKKILGKEHGFEVVGVAANGQEATEVINRLKPHVVTLDIHMPIKNGIEYLESVSPKDRPPVVMVSSVSRDDAALALKALSLGAADYVEKPALNNLEKRADEIRAKLRSAVRSKERSTITTIDKQFSRSLKIDSPQNFACLYVFGLGDVDKCIRVLKDLGTSGLPSYLAVEGADSILPALAERIEKESGIKIQSSYPASPTSGLVAVGALSAAVTALQAHPSLSIMVFGEISKHGAESILSLSGAQLFLEDIGDGKGTAPLADVAADVTLTTSFAYLTQQYFANHKKGNK